MAQRSRVPERMGAECLGEKWEVLGSGGFGEVYKAKHKDYKINVAIKLLHDGVGAPQEANIMDLASCEFILRVYGIFEGRPPVGLISQRKGIVMEFMQKGCVQTLQEKLRGHPPWPLAFRLAHEVALGINFLHSKNIVHNDLKPSNVLLNDDLHAKLADFGLSKVSASVLINTEEMTSGVGGTYKYMPPEAFDLSYKLVRSFDIYSYGVFLWSLFSGTEPYSSTASFELLAFHIPRGQRPSPKIDCSQSEGLEELVNFMEECWDGDASKRPDSSLCCDITEDVYLKHKNHIISAVRTVLERLESPLDSPTPESPSANDVVDHFKPENVQHKTQQDPPEQEWKEKTPSNNLRKKPPAEPGPSKKPSASTDWDVVKMSDADKAKFVVSKRAKLIRSVSEVMDIVEQLGDMVQEDMYYMIKSQPTDSEKMRELFDGPIRSGGERVKAAFYDILRRDYGDLVRRLGEES